MFDVGATMLTIYNEAKNDERNRLQNKLGMKGKITFRIR